ncbi:MAG: hypothetical protein LBO74_12520 [Candidatus Symbiothrix sp.]|jgi:hypothetical protein|nr:hypothetical protein [Candidatus Symbiothrix sp.]
MEQRDYLLRQAELFGQVLGKLLAKLLNLKNQEQTSSVIEVSNQAFPTYSINRQFKIEQIKNNSCVG